jgi:uncharacterized protein (UPF0218 family)
MRSELKEPMGEVSTEVEKDRLTGRVIAVGDMVTYHLLEAGVRPDVAVVDGRTEREEVDEEVIERWKEVRVAARVENEPGTVSEGLVGALGKAYEKGGLVEVDGEEDLAVLPAVALASDGDTVVYGQPGEGMVYVEVDEEAQRYVLELLDRMDGEGVLSGLRNS